MVVSMAEEDSEPQISEVFLHGGRSKYGFVRFAFNFKDTVFFSENLYGWLLKKPGVRAILYLHLGNAPYKVKRRLWHFIFL